MSYPLIRDVTGSYTLVAMYTIILCINKPDKDQDVGKLALPSYIVK